MKYNYLAGGISIASDIHFPEMVQSANVPEAFMSYGDVPDSLDINYVDFPFLQLNKRQYLLKLPGMGSYLVEDGNKITIAAEEGASLPEVNRQVLTSPFAALGYQRGLIPFHGGVVSLDGNAYLISGLSGAGKSTLLAALSKRGYTVISDDISHVQLIDDKPIVHPSFPRLMVWHNAAEELDVSVKEADKLRTDLQKYLVPIDETAFKSPMPLKHIFVLNNGLKSGEVQPIRGMAKIHGFKNNLFHPYLLEALGVQKEYTMKLLSIASQVGLSFFGNDRTKGISILADTFEQALINVK